MMLDLDTTKYYLSCYGTDISRWPEPDAGKTALAVYANDLGSELRETIRLDNALTGAPLNPPSDLLARRILSNLPAQDGAATYDTSSPRVLNWRAIAATLIALGAAGFATLSLQSPPASEAVTESEIWREAALDMGVDDVFDWVYSEDG